MGTASSGQRVIVCNACDVIYPNHNGSTKERRSKERILFPFRRYAILELHSKRFKAFGWTTEYLPSDGAWCAPCSAKRKERHDGNA